LQTIIGDQSKNKEKLKKYSSYYVLEIIKPTNQKIWMDCGTEDFLLDLNRKFHQKLLDKKIEHVYLEKPGAHTLNYWKHSYKKQILFINEKLDHELHH
jgi:enterochelin esterase-like enzyme